MKKLGVRGNLRIVSIPDANQLKQVFTGAVAFPTPLHFPVVVVIGLTVNEGYGLTRPLLTFPGAFGHPN